MGMFPTSKEDRRQRAEELLEELEHPEDFPCRGKGFTGIMKKYIDDNVKDKSQLDENLNLSKSGLPIP